MVDFPIIALQDNKATIIIKSGYKINSTYNCFQEFKNNWVIVDSASGLYIMDGIKTGKDCFEIVKNMDEKLIEKINNAKSKTRYTEIVKNLKKWKQFNI